MELIGIDKMELTPCLLGSVLFDYQMLWFINTKIIYVHTHTHKPFSLVFSNIWNGNNYNVVLSYLILNLGKITDLDYPEQPNLTVIYNQNNNPLLQKGTSPWCGKWCNLLHLSEVWDCMSLLVPACVACFIHQ